MSVSLVEFSDAVAEIIAAAAPSVVGVGRAGSGVVVADGLVVTNAHNLRGEVAVSFEDGRVAVASVAGADMDGDLAVLSVDTAGAPALAWSEDVPALGHVVIGLSRPGGRSLRAGAGFISGLGVSFRGPGGSSVTGALEHGAPLVPGSSGGPLVGSDGRLVGINTHRAGEGFYLALCAMPWGCPTGTVCSCTPSNRMVLLTGPGCAGGTSSSRLAANPSARPANWRPSSVP